MIWVLLSIGCTDVKSEVMSWMPLKVDSPEQSFTSSKNIELRPWVSGLTQVTDLQFFGHLETPTAVVLQKDGHVWLVSTGNEPHLLMDIPVKFDSEQGLLGVAIHPNFETNQRIYIHRTPSDGIDRTEIAEYVLDLDQKVLSKNRVLLEVAQPYPNHNGGALHFGADGMLYVGLGDGGWRNDPHGNGQDPTSLLGTIVRMNVDQKSIVPLDNPFVGTDTHHELAWVTGVRNPWKFQPLSDGKILIADVGQNAWEEISVASKGANLGWAVWEGNACFIEPCTEMDPFGVQYTKPVHTYNHSEGQSITGGVVVPSSLGPMYLFSDFLSGTLWGLTNWDTNPHVDTLASLGFNVSTLSIDHQNQPYVVDFVGGVVYQISGIPQ